MILKFIIFTWLYLQAGYLIGKLVQYVYRKRYYDQIVDQRWWLEVLDYIIWPSEYTSGEQPKDTMEMSHQEYQNHILKLFLFFWTFIILIRMPFIILKLTLLIILLIAIGIHSFAAMLHKKAYEHGIYNKFKVTLFPLSIFFPKTNCD